MPDVCTDCGKDVVKLEACEGEKIFHLDCYVLYKGRGSTGPRSSAGHWPPETLPVRSSADVALAEALTPGATCLPCLVRTTGVSETQIVRSLRQFGAGVVVTVGPCSRCDPGRGGSDGLAHRGEARSSSRRVPLIRGGSDDPGLITSILSDGASPCAECIARETGLPRRAIEPVLETVPDPSDNKRRMYSATPA